jgi:hypothetical protein
MIQTTETIGRKRSVVFKFSPLTGEIAMNRAATTEFSKAEWRSIEQPTYKIRMRIVCNLIKQALLQDGHDPWSPQSGQVILHPRSPVIERDTWESWWYGESVPKATMVAKVDEVASNAANWLDPSCIGSPLKRHLASLDAMALEILKDGDWKKEKERRAENSLQSILRVWEIFTTDTWAADAMNEDSMRAQIAPDQLPTASMEFADIHLRAHAITGVFNPYVLSLPREITTLYNYLEPYSIFPFLIKYADFTRLSNASFRRVWMMDIASLVAILRVHAYCSCGGHGRLDSHRGGIS